MVSSAFDLYFNPGPHNGRCDQGGGECGRDQTVAEGSPRWVCHIGNVGKGYAEKSLGRRFRKLYGGTITRAAVQDRISAISTEQKALNRRQMSRK